jgi:hypothetical protein
MALATMLGMVINLSGYSPLRIGPGYSLNVIWSLGSIAVLLLAVQVCVEPPRPRVDERFDTDEPALLAMADAPDLRCIVRDISVGGAHLERAEGWAAVAAGRLTFLADGTSIRFRPVRMRGARLAVRFDDDTRSRRMMTAKIFTGRYHNDIGHVSVWAVLRTAAQAVFA